MIRNRLVLGVAQLTLLTLAGFSVSACSAKIDTPTLVSSAVDGVWATTCATTSSLPGATHVVNTLLFTNGTFSYTQSGYSDTCTTLVLTVTQGGTFSVGSTDGTVTTATDIDLVQAAYTAKPETSAETTTLNTGPVCTGVTFTNGQASSIAGTSCGGSPIPANAATIKGLFIVTSSSSPYTLQMTDLTQTTRPTSISGATTFTKL